MPPIATFQCPWQVRFVDTDASGFAHFSTYLRMMEETEYAFLRSRGLNVILHDDRGTMGFPRTHAAVNIIRPLTFEQNVTVHLSLTQFDGKQIVFEFNIIDDQHQSAVTGKFIVACCRFPDQKLPFAVVVPPHVAEALIR